MEDKSLKNYFMKVAVWSLFFHLLLAYFSVGFYQYDEQYQILEFLSLKLGRSTPHDLTWEYHEKMRSWIQPGLYYALAKISGFKSFDLAFVIRLFTGVIGFLGQVYLIRNTLHLFQDEKIKKAYILLGNLIWFFPFIHVRPSSESVSGIILSFAIGYFFSQKRNSFLLGILFGLSYLFRFQMGLVVAGFWFWQLFIHKEQARSLIGQALGIIVTFILGIVIDYWGYGEWTYSPWNYFYHNLVLGKQAGYDYAPWWKMVEYVFLKGIPPLSILILLSYFYLILKRRSHFLLWAMTPLILIHLYASGKHIRFLFPLACLVPLMICVFLDDFKSIYKKYRKSFSFIMIINVISLILLIPLSSNKKISVLTSIHKLGETPIYYWGEHPTIKTPGKLNFYYQGHDKLIEFKKENVSKIEEAFYIYSDRIFRYHYLKGELHCKVLNKPFYHDFYVEKILRNKDNKRLLTLFYCKR